MALQWLRRQWPCNGSKCLPCMRPWQAHRSMVSTSATPRSTLLNNTTTFFCLSVRTHEAPDRMMKLLTTRTKVRELAEYVSLASLNEPYTTTYSRFEMFPILHKRASLLNALKAACLAMHIRTLQMLPHSSGIWNEEYHDYAPLVVPIHLWRLYLIKEGEGQRLAETGFFKF